MLNYRSFSQTILVGRLGQDAKLRNTKSGGQMLSFSVGTSVSTKKDGKYEQATSWHDCLAFGPRAEKLAEVLAKGTLVSVQGSISYREVELANGFKGRIASILVEDIQILADSKAKSARPNEAHSAPQEAETGSEEALPC
ncbi:single-stranded DNA-binding protein [Sutterella sp.]|uniref:single-stranded DNA-binding protein n=1 Tax=Sutterella sp. TaxID=1981025 RepID=UPI003FD770EE